MPGAPSLEDLCLSCLAANAQLLTRTSLVGVPEELVVALFNLVVARGKLTPKALAAFTAAEHAQVLDRIAHLGISSWTPPLVPDSREWLGAKRLF
jgi:hypothetical protein